VSGNLPDSGQQAVNVDGSNLEVNLVHQPSGREVVAVPTALPSLASVRSRTKILV
jgi:hypothetical protein